MDPAVRERIAMDLAIQSVTLCDSADICGTSRRRLAVEKTWLDD
jgi:hypothetical protein